MKNILTGWDLTRIFYLAGGIWVVAQGIIDKIWFLAPVGLYFIYLAVFRKGCAGGSCEINYEPNNDKTQ